MSTLDAVLDEQVDQENLDQLRVDAEDKLATLRDEIDAINDAKPKEDDMSKLVIRINAVGRPPAGEHR